jgi:hypothetical protein
MLGDLLDEELGAALPPAAKAMLEVMADMLRQFDDKIADLDKEIGGRASADAVCRRLMTILGHRSDRGDCAGGARPAGRDVPPWSRLRGVARSNSPAAINRREDQTRTYVEDGRANPAALAHYRQQFMCARSEQARRASGFVA